MKQSLNSLLVKHSSLQQLLSAGFLYLDELEGLTPVELSKETNLSLGESLQVIDEVRKHRTDSLSAQKHATHVPQAKDTILPTAKPIPQSVSSLELFWREQEQIGVPTGCKEMDEMLGEGIPLGKMTEISGVPGIGKSQLAFQLCINSCLAKGVDRSEAVLIDTEGSFVVQRARQMAEAACVDSMYGNVSERGEGVEQCVVTSDSVLSRIHYFRCLDVVQLLCVVNTLEQFVQERKAEGSRIKLVAIDSIAFPFRMDMHEVKMRSRLLQTLSQALMELAQRFGLAVVLTNQMTVRPSVRDPEGRMQQVPALGDSWAHIPTIRLMLQWSGPVRTARLAKSPTHIERVVSYEITDRGVSDLVGRRGSKRELDSDQSNEYAAKASKKTK